MRENGEESLGMDKEPKYGKMELHIQVTGRIIKHKAKENLFIQMEIYMKVNGLTIKLMASVSINMLMGQNIQDFGKMIYSTVQELKLGLMVLVIMEIMTQAESKDWGHINGAMVPSLVETGVIIKSMDLDIILGLTAEATKDLGKIIICMNLEYINGKMENNMQGSIKTTRNKVMEFIPGKIVENTLDSGKMINNMVWVYMYRRGKIKEKQDFGKTEKELNGLMKSRLNKQINFSLIIHYTFRIRQARMVSPKIVNLLSQNNIKRKIFKCRNN